MDFKFSHLRRDLFPQIHRTFLAAFSDYQIDMSYMTPEVLRLRMRKNAVEYESSVGVFDRDKMVGFTLIGIDRWRGDLTAFDAGTGIIRDFRGQGLAKKMFDFAMPRLKNRGARRFVLEVLQDNEAAIKAYQKAAFRIRREFDCFELNIREARQGLQPAKSFKIIPVDKNVLPGFKPHLDWEPSWENSFTAMIRISRHLKMYGAIRRDDREEPVGLLVYCPHLNWIMSLIVKKEQRKRGIATRLVRHFFESIEAGQDKVKLLNVDRSDIGMTEFLAKMRFRKSASQFEMELNL